MPSFLPHRISPPSKLVVLNQACFDLPTASSEERKWGDDEEVEVADNEDSSRRLDKGKAPMESQNADDMNESTEDSTSFTPLPRRSPFLSQSDPSLITLNQECDAIPSSSSSDEGNDTDEEEEEAYFESDPSEICDDDDDTEMEDDMAEATRGFEQLYMPRRITQAQWEEIEQYAEGTNKEVALHELITPRKLRRQRKPRPSSERRKWGDDCVEEEAESDEEGYAQITMDFREPRSPVGSIDSDTPIVRLDANILHPRALRMLGFTTKEGLELEGMTEALTTMFKDPTDYTPSAMPHACIIPRETSTPNNAAGRAPEPIRSLVKLNQSCVELPTSSSERRKWGDDCVEEEAESDEEGYAQITMDFREPRSPVGSIDSDTPIVRLDANILHPRALRMLGFTTKEGLVKLNQSCVELPTSSSERRKWGDECVEEEAELDEEGYAQITMDFREPRSPVGSIDSDTPIVRLDANILHPRALRMLGFTTKEGLEFEGMTEALTTMFKDPADYVLEAPRARSVMKQLDRAQEVHSQVSSSSSFTTGDTGSAQTPSAMPHRQIIPRETSTPNNAAGRAPEPIRSLVKLNQSCVELPTSSSERRKWGDDCVEEEAESDEEGYAQITMDFREPRSPVGSIDSDTPIVRLDANILHPRALRMLGFTTNEGLELEGMMRL
ncbi:hypothetical protein K7X08_014142 [Anisodus acutangulus]|uniref:Uncharacterized protein n=1 Tax=Anisodus acutangulus TaxID=402998 RepID=A0A9Q1R5W6_9SOLA|nr:hypothetical protein K7X08_014142 [Anisodus acutangulus]